MAGPKISATTASRNPDLLWRELFTGRYAGPEFGDDA